MSSLFFAGQGAEEADKILDLRVREIEAEGGHPRLSDRRASLLDDVEEVLVRERLRATRVGEVSWSHQEERRTPGAVATRPVAGDAVGEVEPLGWRGVGRGSRWGPEGDEDHEVDDDYANRCQEKEPAGRHGTIIARNPSPCPTRTLLTSSPLPPSDKQRDGGGGGGGGGRMGGGGDLEQGVEEEDQTFHTAGLAEPGAPRPLGRERVSEAVEDDEAPQVRGGPGEPHALRIGDRVIVTAVGDQEPRPHPAGRGGG